MYNCQGLLCWRPQVLDVPNDSLCVCTNDLKICEHLYKYIDALFANKLFHTKNVHCPHNVFAANYSSDFGKFNLLQPNKISNKI